MLFDPKPKEKKKDFFNYEEELNAFITYLNDKNNRLIVIKGLRRTGKSSLLRVGLNEAKAKSVLIDTRELTSLSRRSFEAKLLEELKSIKGLASSILAKIESIDVGISISMKKEENLWKTLKTINPIIAVDEIQMLKGTGVDSFCAAVYDNTNCKIILTGSEVGVLDEFIGKDNTKAPLFGRAYAEIKTHPLTPEKSKKFIMSGFKEIEKRINQGMIEKVVQELDGIVGWLTLFGNTSISTDLDTALNNSIVTGAKLAYSELESFLDGRPAAKKRYLTLMRILANSSMRWSDIKRSVQIELKESISDSQFSNYLNSLVDYGFIVLKEDFYSIPDPLLKKALIGGISN